MQLRKFNSILETIGNTPLIKINHITQYLPCDIYAKVEYFNPGNSIKDRVAHQMIKDAEKKGVLKKGGTIIEGTSGNTGMGLALMAIAKGYKCIFTVTDKQSQEKINILKAMGAEVIVCPTNVPPEDPKSYYSVAKKLNEETPNSFYPNQYDNLSNRAVHYQTTGAEVWEQTEGKVSHFIAGVGTGGTISGISQYLKDKNSNIHTVGVDSYGSVFKKYKETGSMDMNEVFPYLTEGIGEDILPQNVNFEVIDEFIKVTDRDAALMARRLAKEEGLFIGWSCGAAMAGTMAYAEKHGKKGDLIVVVFPDHGTRYINKIYNDEWMQDHGFLEKDFTTARHIISKQPPVISVKETQRIAEVIHMMNTSSISQIPVISSDLEVVGSLTDTKVLHKLIQEPDLKDRIVRDIMDKPFVFVGLDETIDTLSSVMDQNSRKAVLVRDENGTIKIITRHDLLLALMN